MGMKPTRIAGLTWDRGFTDWTDLAEGARTSPSLTSKDIPGLALLLTDVGQHGEKAEVVTITHTVTGKDVTGRCFGSITKAAAAAARLAELADWTLPEDAILRIPGIGDAVSAAVKRAAMKPEPGTVTLPVGVLDGKALLATLRAVKEGTRVVADNATGIHQESERSLPVALVVKYLSLTPDAIVKASLVPHTDGSLTYTLRLFGYGQMGTSTARLQLVADMQEVADV